MKQRMLALCAAAALVLTACADGAAAAKTLQNRKKQVVLYVTQTNYNEDGTEALRFDIRHRYDEDGNLVGMDNYDGQGSRWEYTYNGDGVKVAQTYYDPEGQVESTCTYDLNGNPVHREGTTTVFYADGTVEERTVTTDYSYDDLGRSTELVMTSDDIETLRQTWSYDDTAHTATRHSVSTDLRGNSSSYTDELTFNEDWQILTSHRNTADGNGALDEVYTYDEAGNEISCRSTGISDWEEESSYDEEGNLLQMRYLSNGTLMYEQTSTLGTLVDALQRQESAA